MSLLLMCERAGCEEYGHAVTIASAVTAELCVRCADEVSLSARSQLEALDMARFNRQDEMEIYRQWGKNEESLRASGRAVVTASHDLSNAIRAVIATPKPAVSR